jgi:hypothetical protein
MARLTVPGSTAGSRATSLWLGQESAGGSPPDASSASVASPSKDATARALVVEPDDELVAAELAQDVGFSLEAGIVLGLQCGLEHLLLALVVHEQCERRRALSDPLLDDDAVQKGIVRFRPGGVGDDALLELGCRDLVLELLQLIEEIRNRVEPPGYLGVGAELDQILEGLLRPVDHGGDLRALASRSFSPSSQKVRAGAAPANT